MTFKKTLAVATCVAAVASFASGALAQTAPAAAPAAPQLRYAAPIAGLCVYNPDALIELSLAGKGAITRLEQLAKQAQDEVSAEGAKLDADAKTFQAQAPAMALETREQTEAQLRVRGQQLERKVQIRQRELGMTQEKQYGVIWRAATPHIRTVFQNRNCSVLLTNGVVFAAPQMDITGDVATALNATLKPFSFNRENLGQQQGAPQVTTPAAAAKPATPPKK